MYPALPKLELFARQRRPGWDVWGNETDKFSGAGPQSGGFAATSTVSN
jgi:N6-adenosine-specific RNA methylase IME4